VGTIDDLQSTPSIDPLVPTMLAIKFNLVTLLLLERDCIKFYEKHSRKYLANLQSQLTSSDNLIRAHREVIGYSPSNHDIIVDYLQKFDQEIQAIIAALYDSLGYSGISAVSGVPKLFVDADPDIMKSFDIEEDGFEIL
jgi:hypothetical protein